MADDLHISPEEVRATSHHPTRPLPLVGAVLLFLGASYLWVAGQETVVNVERRVDVEQCSVERMSPECAFVLSWQSQVPDSERYVRWRTVDLIQQGGDMERWLVEHDPWAAALLAGEPIPPDALWLLAKERRWDPTLPYVRDPDPQAIEAAQRLLAPLGPELNQQRRELIEQEWARVARHQRPSPPNEDGPSSNPFILGAALAGLALLGLWWRWRPVQVVLTPHKMRIGGRSFAWDEIERVSFGSGKLEVRASGRRYVLWGLSHEARQALAQATKQARERKLQPLDRRALEAVRKLTAE